MQVSHYSNHAHSYWHLIFSCLSLPPQAHQDCDLLVHHDLYLYAPPTCDILHERDVQLCYIPFTTLLLVVDSEFVWKPASTPERKQNLIDTLIYFYSLILLAHEDLFPLSFSSTSGSSGLVPRSGDEHPHTFEHTIRSKWCLSLTGN